MGQSMKNLSPNSKFLYSHVKHVSPLKIRSQEYTAVQTQSCILFNKMHGEIAIIRRKLSKNIYSIKYRYNHNTVTNVLLYKSLTCFQCETNCLFLL